jgi:hypothetical protein
MASVSAHEADKGGRKPWKVPSMTTLAIGVAPAVLITCSFPNVECKPPGQPDVCASSCGACPAHHC